MAKAQFLQQLLEPTVVGLGYEFVGVEYIAQGKHSLLRVFIDKPDGISADDCGEVSRQVSALLDVEDPIRGEYTLEVSSPGLDRPLFNEAQFTQFLGYLGVIRTRIPVQGRRNFKGKMLSIEKGMLTVEVDGHTYEIEVEDIEKANLVPEF